MNSLPLCASWELCGLALVFLWWQQVVCPWTVNYRIGSDQQTRWAWMPGNGCLTLLLPYNTSLIS